MILTLNNGPNNGPNWSTYLPTMPSTRAVSTPSMSSTRLTYHGSFSFLPPRLGVASSGDDAEAGALHLRPFFQFGLGTPFVATRIYFPGYFIPNLLFFHKLVTLLLSLYCKIDACCAHSSSRQLNSSSLKFVFLSRLTPPAAVAMLLTGIWEGECRGLPLHND